MPRLALLYLLALTLVGWGYGIGRFEIFPAGVIREVEAFAMGHDLGADTSVVEKLANDAGLVPTRYMRKYPERAAADSVALTVPGLRSRREAPTVFVGAGHGDGYRAVFGALDYEDAFWGGVLLGPGGEFLHGWRLTTDHLTDAADTNVTLYGLHLDRDGSVIFSLQEDGGGIVKVDACSNVLWSTEGKFHHTISPTGDGHVWSYAGAQYDLHHELVKLSTDDGRIVQTVDMRDALGKNPFVHIFDLQRRRAAEDSDASHGNDIEPLGSEMAPYFPMFEAGDLLLSYRTHSLVFVLDPDAISIRWWRIGAWDRQHDPDWEADGTISVFSNNERSPREYSDIVAIDPATYESEVLVDGEDFGFYSTIMGEHELTQYGTRMVASTTQGWAFEVDDAGEIVFSFVNNYDGDELTSLDVSKAQRFDEGFFTTEFWNKCPN